MSYQVIARKWRPQTFDDLVGQQHVTETLKNAIKNDRVAHAYIFSGARGVGKTTAARILAKALNCVKGPTATPCGECDSCKEIASGTSLDVIEIDAASNRGIDQIRELREMVRYAPAASRSKVVILDEAHMLTGEASNALLKTLEEPPDRVIFVMATTQPEDLVDTIRSRSQHFHFRALTFAEIAGRLEEIAKKEDLKIEPGAMAVIARMAEGSLRDALSLPIAVTRFPTKKCATCLAWYRTMRWRNWLVRFRKDRRTVHWGWCTPSRRKGAIYNTSAAKQSGTCAIC